MILEKMSCINGCMVISNLVISQVPYIMTGIEFQINVFLEF